VNRRNWGDRGSFGKMQQGLAALRAHGLSYAGICVLTEASLPFPDEIFEFFLNEKFSSVGFNAEEIEGFNTSSSLSRPHSKESERSRQSYCSFMERICDLWIKHQSQLAIREFELVSSKMVTAMTRPNFIPVQDVARGMKIITVRLDGKLITFSPELASGSVCDSDKFVIGSVDALSDLEAIFSNLKYRQMSREIQRGIRRCEDECRYFKVCGGGWPSNKFFENGTFDSTETSACVFAVQAVVDALQKKLFQRLEFRESLKEYVADRSEP
jgi:uncharacterized protein